jgi:hypothetical protein
MSKGADEEWNGFETAVRAFDDQRHIHLIGNWYFIQLLAYCFSRVSKGHETAAVVERFARAVCS